MGDARTAGRARRSARPKREPSLFGEPSSAERTPLNEPSSAERTPLGEPSSGERTPLGEPLNKRTSLGRGVEPRALDEDSSATPSALGPDPSAAPTALGQDPSAEPTALGQDPSAEPTALDRDPSAEPRSPGDPPSAVPAPPLDDPDPLDPRERLRLALALGGAGRAGRAATDASPRSAAREATDSRGKAGASGTSGAGEPKPAEDDARGAAPADWRRLLCGASPREVLARIANGDPLGVRAVVAERVDAGAWLVDADRVHLRALARCARFGPRYHGRPAFSEWLGGVVDEALADVVREERELAWRPPSSAASDADAADDAFASPAFVELARPLGLDPAAMRAACARFNHLDAPVRRAFQAMLLQGRSLDELARAWREPATEIARRARRGLDALLAGERAEEMP